ncbi:MAG: porin family protein [Mesorhizobium amorphae]|nr:MAG: porin family protein [Mesorhizobium amorphae]
MGSFTKRLLLTAVAAAAASQAWAADLAEPYIEPQPPEEVAYEPVATGGWYIRGDVGYHDLELRGKPEYILYGEPGLKGEFDKAELDTGWSLGGGIGYRITDHLRADVTADHFFDTDFSGSTLGCDRPAFGGCDNIIASRDSTSVSAWLLLANAYWDFYSYKGFTFYGGGGIGGAHVKWDKLKNVAEYSDGDEETQHEGGKEWRFAWSLAAGTSYCLSKNLEADLGYRFARVEGGQMFDYANGGGPGFDGGFNVHQARAGLRYSFGGNPACGPQEVVAYEPAPEPVYK